MKRIIGLIVNPVAGMGGIIIIADYRLPGMNRLDFLKRIHTPYPHIK